MSWLRIELVTSKYNSELLPPEPTYLVQLLPWIGASFMFMHQYTSALRDISDGYRMSCVHNAPHLAQIIAAGSNPFPND